MDKSFSLKYDKDYDNAPKITAKGKGEIAKQIIMIAKEKNIPIYKDEILTDILDNLQLNIEVPEYLYEAIAEIYSFTYKLLSGENINQT